MAQATVSELIGELEKLDQEWRSHNLECERINKQEREVFERVAGIIINLVSPIFISRDFSCKATYEVYGSNQRLPGATYEKDNGVIEFFMHNIQFPTAQLKPRIKLKTTEFKPHIEKNEAAQDIIVEVPKGYLQRQTKYDEDLIFEEEVHEGTFVLASEIRIKNAKDLYDRVCEDVKRYGRILDALNKSGDHRIVLASGAQICLKPSSSTLSSYCDDEALAAKKRVLGEIDASAMA